MATDLSKSQIERLGLRLVAEEGPSEEDLDLLRRLLLARSEQLDRAEARLRAGLDIVPTSRVKNTETILEKLRRGGGSGLKSIQDLAGMRIVGNFDRRGQDELVEQIVALFSDGVRASKVVDRRAKPMHGYRAVHAIVFPDGAPIEIQVRTEWQHEWAEFFEKLADHVGRDVRYGRPPAKWWTPEEARSSSVRRFDEAEYRLRKATVAMALAAADMIDAVEAGEFVDPSDRDRPQREVERALRGLQRNGACTTSPTWTGHSRDRSHGLGDYYLGDGALPDRL
jgi:ppGpp synthetase/RelA/SpoT-type nucleotidyltranferase